MERRVSREGLAAGRSADPRITLRSIRATDGRLISSPFPATLSQNAVEEGVMNRTLRTSRAALLAAAVLWSTAVPAQDTAAIFKDKTVDIYTGYTVGGRYDLYTRIFARHLATYL